MLFGSKVNYLSKNKRALSKYSVGSQEPGLAFDFIDNVYQKDQNKTVNFDGAITHVRSGNATMTDGYGPELVVNGGFDSDVSGWQPYGDAATTVVYENGRALVDGATTNDGIYQTITVEPNKTYIFEADIERQTATGILLASNADIPTNAQTTDQKTRISGQFSTTTSTSVSIRITNNSSSTGTFYVDNVSVREMPVIKWAPHNLLSYSEDLSQTVWVDINGTLAADSFTASNDNNAHYFFQDIATISPTDHTASFEIKAYGDAQYFQIAFGINDVSGNPFVNFDLLSGTITADANSVGTIVDVGDGWYRCEVSVVSTVSSNFAVVGVAIGSSSATRLQAVDASALNLNYGIRRAHLYRSDLGGMVDNPDQPASRASYVPTTSSAVYLPRIGHHVYNGSAWVNEGLLAESEARTNLAPQSDMSTATLVGGTRTANDAVSPDGTENAFRLESNTTTSNYLGFNGVVTSGQSYAVSIYAKAGNNDIIRIGNVSSPTSAQWFDLTNGTLLTNNGANNTATIQDVGNGWYRCTRYFDSVTTSGSPEIFVANSDADNSVNSVSGEYVYLYGFQIENNATSSSFIPTSGSSVTRASETFTIPSANLPWPEPNYIGSELVTNGTFDTDTSGWTGNFAGATLSVDSQRLKISVSGAASGYAYQEVPTVAGKVYSLKVDKTDGTNTAWGVLVESTNWVQGPSSTDADGSYEYYFVASDASTNVRLYGYGDGTHVFYDNVSVREINPLSVSIAMDGRVSYADTGVASETEFVNWEVDSNNLIDLYLSTASSATGRVVYRQKNAGTSDVVETGGTAYSPDILVPFNIASRHGSTFVNGAVDGVALTADTTPTALPDLSATDLDLAYDYMGTIGTFRVWDKDITDDGIVEATNPSLEPSLSLTFEGTGTNSFIVNDWSE